LNIHQAATQLKISKDYHTIFIGKTSLFDEVLKIITFLKKKKNKSTARYIMGECSLVV
jgi:hypothetical protein